jgi:hypothetical protein
MGAIIGALGAGVFVASLLAPRAGGAVAFGLGQTMLLGAAAGLLGAAGGTVLAGLSAATCIE